MKYCAKCGAELMDEAVTCPKCGCACGGAAYGGIPGTAAPSMSLVDAVKKVYTHYADFNGRARRSEYWMWTLYMMVVNFVLCLFTCALLVLLRRTLKVIGLLFAIVYLVWALGSFIPSLAVTIRRLHDTGKSGAYYLFVLIPFGSIALLIWECTDSQPDANMYGPNPKYLQ